MAVMPEPAIVLAVYRPVLFLALVAVFSFYFAFRGYRGLSRKRPEQGQGPKALDWLGAVLALLGGMALLVLGITPPSPMWVNLCPVAIVFAIVGVLLAGAGLRAVVVT